LNQILLSDRKEIKYLNVLACTTC